jgi:hypothetical protein
MPGDSILGINLNDNAIFSQMVTKNTAYDHDGEIISIEIPNGRFLKVTKNQNIYTYNRKWITAKDLNLKDKIQEGDDGIVSIRSELYRGVVFEIECSHIDTYFAEHIINR